MGDLAELGAGLAIRRARLRGTSAPPPPRRVLEGLLADCSAAEIGLPASALLILPRLAPGPPLVARSPARQAAFRQAVQEGLRAGRRQAVRPWLDPGSDAGQPVLFVDQAELAACLVRDWLSGTLAGRWWATAVLGTADIRTWWRRELLPRGDLLVPVLGRLSVAGAVVAWVGGLDTQELALGSRAIATAYGLDLDRLPATPLRSPDTPPPDPAIACARAELERRVPEVAEVVGSSPRLRLLVLALGLYRDPTWCRGPQLAQALEAVAAPAPGIEVDAAGRSGSADTPAPRIDGPRRSAALDIDADANSSDARVAPPEPRPSTAGFPTARSAVAALQTDAAPKDASGRHVAAIGGARPPRVPAVVCGSPFPLAVDDEPRAEHPVLRDGASEPAAHRPALPVADDRLPAGGEASRGAAPCTEAAPPPIVGVDSASRAAPPRSPVAPRASIYPKEVAAPPLAEIVQTCYGGLFYLLNVALGLSLYGDFTQPRRPGIALSPWDWLALVGRRWLGREFCADPLWELLRRLAMRSDEQPPGAGFTPPGTWLVPADWLAPWGGAGPVRIERHRARLRLWHPAGFLLADVPRRAGVSPMVQAQGLLARWPVLTLSAGFRCALPMLRGDRRRWQPRPSPLACWLDQLLSYLEARLALALGVDDPANVPLLVCRHRARVEVSSTALDINFSLAELPIALRVAGLDRDPGWLPAAGRAIAFHFQ